MAALHTRLRECWTALAAALLWLSISPAGMAGTESSSLKLEDITQISAGGKHACALTGEGAVRCWGDNTFGQLGDGSYERRPYAVAVRDLPASAIRVVAGSHHSCALLSDQSVYCWGDNTYGQLGNNSDVASRTPVRVAGLDEGALTLSAGRDHNCSLVSGFGVKCWGINSDYQLGTGDNLGRISASQVFGLDSGISGVSAGSEHSCALTATSGVKCWGTFRNGQIGDGTTEDRPTATDTANLGDEAHDLGTGTGHSCVVLASGAMKCWGNNLFRQLGNGTPYDGFSGDDQIAPVGVVDLPSTGTPVSVDLGSEHSCVRFNDGSVSCWGRNDSGQTGVGNTSPSTATGSLVGLDRAALAVSAGQSFSCALLDSGKVQCWGSNLEGQLGDDSGGNQPYPVFVQEQPALRQVEVVRVDANARSLDAQPDAAGRFVVFQSSADNLLVEVDDNAADDIFLVEPATGETRRVSLLPLGDAASCAGDACSQGCGDAFEPSISADGSLAVFVATECTSAGVPKRLLPGFKGPGFGVFLRNMLTGQTTRLGPAASSGVGTRPQLAPGGNSVVFTSPVTDPVAENLGQNNVFRVPLQPGGVVNAAPTCVTCKSISAMGVDTGQASDGESRNPVLSADGQWLAFETVASNSSAAQPSPCPPGNAQVMLRNMLTGALQRVSPPADLGLANCASSGSTQPSIDYSGQQIAFVSDQGLAPGVLPGQNEVFVSETRTGSTTRVSEPTSGLPANGPSAAPAISGDGRTVAYESQASNLDETFIDSNAAADAYVYRLGGFNTRLSRGAIGVQANAPSQRLALTYNGTRLLFDSAADNLDAGANTPLNRIFSRAVPAALTVVFASDFE